MPLFQKFIVDSHKGRRLQPNGKRIGEGTLKNYSSVEKLLSDFSAKKSFELRIREERYLNTRETAREQHYWKKFYKKFTDYLYQDLGYFDNYIGQNIKIIRTFFNYLNKETSIKPGSFHKLFYVIKEEVPIFTLLPEELNHLIYHKEFEQSLSSRMRQVKDVFVFGCTVALRVSDLLALKKSSVRIMNEQYYLAVRSKKTATDTLVKLPDYCIAIILKYKRKSRGLLPPFNKSNLNLYIKKLMEQAGFTQEVSLSRGRRGKRVELKRDNSKKPSYRFCDVVSTHTMRRTAITTMLCLGMPEGVVRKISGHSPASKEFYRYVLWAQTYLDGEAEKMFERLKGKQLRA